MKHDFWLERWQNNEIGFHQAEINGYLQTYWQHLDPVAGAKALVPLCGKSKDMLWLRSQGHSVLGVEISPIAVKDFFAENNLAPEVQEIGEYKQWTCDGLTLLEGDFFRSREEDAQGIRHVFDRASLVALPPEMRSDYARHLQRIVPVDANVLLVAFDYDQTEMQGPPFAVGEGEIRQLYDQRFEIDLLYEQDALPDYPGFKERGLQRLREKIYRLQPR